MIIQASGHEWIVRDVDTHHSPQLADPEKLADIILDIAKLFEAL